MFVPRVAGCDLNTGEGSIVASALCQVWHDCSELFSTKDVEAQNVDVSEHEVRQMELAMEKATRCYYVDDYFKPHRELMAWLIKNYRRRVYSAHDLKNVRCFIETPGDPLTKTNAAGFVLKKQVSLSLVSYFV